MFIHEVTLRTFNTFIFLKLLAVGIGFRLFTLHTFAIYDLKPKKTTLTIPIRLVISLTERVHQFT